MQKRMYVLVVIALVLALVPLVAFAASGTQVISAKALDQANQLGCQAANGWHAVITDVTATIAPTETVWTWSNGATAVVPLEKVTGGTAHYSTTANITSTVSSITATIDISWTGQFNLSCPPKPTAVTMSSISVDGYVIRWTTASEVNAAGFNIVGSDGVKANLALIPARGALAGAKYEFQVATPGKYVIEEVDRNGVSTKYPITVENNMLDSILAQLRAWLGIQ